MTGRIIYIFLFSYLLNIIYNFVKQIIFDTVEKSLLIEIKHLNRYVVCMFRYNTVIQVVEQIIQLSAIQRLVL